MTSRENAKDLIVRPSYIEPTVPEPRLQPAQAPQYTVSEIPEKPLKVILSTEPFLLYTYKEKTDYKGFGDREIKSRTGPKMVLAMEGLYNSISNSIAVKDSNGTEVFAANSKNENYGYFLVLCAFVTLIHEVNDIQTTWMISGERKIAFNVKNGVHNNTYTVPVKDFIYYFSDLYRAHRVSVRAFGKSFNKEVFELLASVPKQFVKATTYSNKLKRVYPALAGISETKAIWRKSDTHYMLPVLTGCELLKQRHALVLQALSLDLERVVTSKKTALSTGKDVLYAISNQPKLKREFQYQLLKQGETPQETTAA